ncbi:MAG: acetyl-CoA C-acyltransferase [Actinobacteria bacterium]|nr:acetyl-CoA C-acyltransferase [Actinomycetota bacterium]
MSRGVAPGSRSAKPGSQPTAPGVQAARPGSQPTAPGNQSPAPGNQPVIVSAARTPIGRFGGALRDVGPIELATLVIREAIARAGIQPSQVDEVVIGHTLIAGGTPNVGRQAAMMADLPVEIPAHGVERQCGTGLQAICDAMMQIQTGMAEVVVAGGVESMSTIEYYVPDVRWGPRLGSLTFVDRWEKATEACSGYRFGVIPSMIHTAANVAEKLSVSREEQDRFALRSQQNAGAAMAAGRFDDEIVPVPVPQKKGDPILFNRDEHPRPETTLESLASLKPIAGDTITAGNSAGLNDGAAACVVMSERKAHELGLEPLAYLRAWTVVGVHPAYMGLGPVPAVKQLLEKTGLTLADIDLIELNEAFAAQALGCLKQLKISDLSNINVNGSGIALGHPIGATGARIMATLLHEMKRRGARYGLETMCIGGGQGIAALVERKT